MLPFTAEDLKAIQTETFIEHLDYFESLASTNSWALNTLCPPNHEDPGRNVNPPSLVLTGKQTAGRGRGNNLWWSAEGALTFSLVVDVQQIPIPLALQPLIALATGLAICETLEKLVPGNQLELKWPNDVFLQQQKVCGILVETTANQPALVVIGVGVNLNNSFLSAEESLRSTGISLYEVTRQKYSLALTLIDLINAIENRLYDIASGKNQLMPAWRQYCMLTGKNIRVTTAAITKTGVCLEVDDDGYLILETDTNTERIISGTIELL